MPERWPEGRGEEAEPDHGENTKGGRAFQTQTARLQTAADCAFSPPSKRQTAADCKPFAICTKHMSQMACISQMAFPTELCEIPIGSNDVRQIRDVRTRICRTSLEPPRTLLGRTPRAAPLSTRPAKGFALLSTEKPCGESMRPEGCFGSL